MGSGSEGAAHHQCNQIITLLHGHKIVIPHEPLLHQSFTMVMLKFCFIGLPWLSLSARQIFLLESTFPSPIPIPKQVNVSIEISRHEQNNKKYSAFANHDGKLSSQ
jgi:hypothetical protein